MTGVPGRVDQPARGSYSRDMAGKSISIRDRANGGDDAVYLEAPRDACAWKLLIKGKDNKISFRWGMYCGSKKGLTIHKDALRFVTGTAIR